MAAAGPPWPAQAARLAAVLALLLALLLPVPAAHAATLDVCPTRAAFSTIKAAIEAAAPGDTIRLCADTFTENVVVTKDLTLLGAGRDDTVVDGGMQGSVVTVPAGVTATISHLTLTHGRVEPSEIVGWGSGGGVHNEGRLTLDDVNVNSSVAYMGGGIANERGELTLRNSIVIDNRAEMGAGIANLGSWEGMATMFVGKSYIVDNFATVDLYPETHDDAGAGGGLYNNDFGLLHVEACDIDSNAAERFGGGIQNSEGWGSAAHLWVTDTIISGNDAYAGGGGINTNATADIVATNIWGNETQRLRADEPDTMGGGIRNTGTLRISNSTINGNYASGFDTSAPGSTPSGLGGGIYTYNWSDAQNPSPDVVLADQRHRRRKQCRRSRWRHLRRARQSAAPKQHPRPQPGGQQLRRRPAGLPRLQRGRRRQLHAERPRRPARHGPAARRVGRLRRSDLHVCAAGGQPGRRPGRGRCLHGRRRPARRASPAGAAL